MLQFRILELLLQLSNFLEQLVQKLQLSFNSMFLFIAHQLRRQGQSSPFKEDQEPTESLQVVL